MKIIKRKTKITYLVPTVEKKTISEWEDAKDGTYRWRSVLPKIKGRKKHTFAQVAKFLDGFAGRYVIIEIINPLTETESRYPYQIKFGDSQSDVYGVFLFDKTKKLGHFMGLIEQKKQP